MRRTLRRVQRPSARSRGSRKCESPPFPPGSRKRPASERNRSLRLSGARRERWRAVSSSSTARISAIGSESVVSGIGDSGGRSASRIRPSSSRIEWARRRRRSASGDASGGPACSGRAKSAVASTRSDAEASPNASRTLRAARKTSACPRRSAIVASARREAAVVGAVARISRWSVRASRQRSGACSRSPARALRATARPGCNSSAR